MTVGILPITGITLPFISYGGSSLISFMIILGIIISIDSKK
jgi:rod shape determining protein RodA